VAAGVPVEEDAGGVFAVGGDVMGDMTKNYSRAEFACKCGCGFAAINPVLVDALQKLRDAMGRPVRVMSGCRCAAHNKLVGGAPWSVHLAGNAADVSVVGMTAREIYRAAAGIVVFHGIGVDDEREFVHLDVREHFAHWCYKRGQQVVWNLGPGQGAGVVA
jgi:uncharacterized protein YcbK (DUF882 family)